MSVATRGSYDCGMRMSCKDGQFCSERGVALADEITNQILERASSPFGKLVLLSSLLCNRRAGAYHHPALDGVVPSCLASLVLRRNHEQVFAIWLELILQEQWKEMREYLAAPEVGEATRGKAPKELWEALIPGSASQPERELFLSDLNLILSLLQN